MVELLTCRKWDSRNNVSMKNIIGQHRVTFTLYLVSILLTTVCLFLTRSLSALFALLAGIIFVAIFLYKKWALLITLIIIGLFLVFPSMAKLLQLMGGPLKQFFVERLNVWSQGLQIILLRPFLGVGAGNFSFPFQSPTYTKFAHNEYIHIVGELGIIVLFLVGFCICTVAREVKKLFISGLSLKSKSEILFASSGGLVLLAQGLFYSNLHLPLTSFILIFFLTKIIVEAQKLSGSISENQFSSASYPRALEWIRWMSLSIATIFLFLVLVIFLGSLYAGKGDYIKAVKFLPLNSEYRKELAIHYEKEKEENKVVSIYEKITKLNPTKADYHQELGNIYYELKDEINGLKEFKLAVKYNPYNPFFHFSLGSYYWDHKEYKRASGEYRKAVDIEPYYSLARLRLGECYLGLGEIYKAREEFYNILKLRELLSASIISAKPYDHRLFQLDYALVYVGLGNSWMEEGDLSQAIREHRKALAINPHSAEAHSGIASVHLSQKRYDLAIDEIKKAIKLEPENPFYREKLKLIENRISGMAPPLE